MSWSAAQYVKFEAERNRPVQDLLAQLPLRAVARAADIGCGPGNSTALLQARFPAAAITGMDSSVDMISAARARLPSVAFETGDITAWAGENAQFDVILANAVLQWVPDHAALLPGLLRRLAPDGSLAVQMPDNLDEPAHLAMRRLAADGPWAARLAAASARRVQHSADWYFQVLRAHGAAVDMWRTTYFHVLQGGPAAVVDWFMGSSLRPFLTPLDAGEQATSWRAIRRWWPRPIPPSRMARCYCRSRACCSSRRSDAYWPTASPGSVPQKASRFR